MCFIMLMFGGCSVYMMLDYVRHIIIGDQSARSDFMLGLTSIVLIVVTS